MLDHKKILMSLGLFVVGAAGIGLVVWAFHLSYASKNAGTQSNAGIQVEEKFFSEGTFSEEDKIYNQHMYYSLRPNSWSRVTKKFGEQLIYSVDYHVDGKRRRINPRNPPISAGKKNQEVLFFGCSFTYGEGVQDEENIPAQLSLYNQKITTLNYATPGYGPGHLLSFMENYPVENDVADKKTAKFIYVFPDFHIRRSLGTMFILATFAHAYPYYELNDSGELVRQGSLLSAKPWQTKISKLLWQLNFIREKNLDFPSYCSYSDDENYLVFKIIEKAARIWKQKMNDQFYVLLFPGFDYGLKKMGPWFKAANIKIIDYTGLIPDWHQNKTKWMIPYDEHPSRLSYEVIGKALAHDLVSSGKPHLSEL